MTQLLEDLTWTQRAEVFDLQAKHCDERGDARGAEFARVNAATMRIMAEDEGQDS